MHLDLHEAVTSCCMVWVFCCLFGVLVSGFIFYIQFHLATLQTVKQAVKTVLF